MLTSHRRQLNRELVRSSKCKPCMDCGEEYPYYVMDFDHRDSNTKVADISRLVHYATTQTLLNEMGKCDVVCSNCHRVRMYARQKREGR